MQLWSLLTIFLPLKQLLRPLPSLVLQLSSQTIAAAFLGHHICYNSWETGRENPSLSPVAEGSVQAQRIGTFHTDASLLPFLQDSSTKTGTSEQHSPARTSRDNSGLLKARQVMTTHTHIKRSRASQPSQSQNSLFSSSSASWHLLSCTVSPSRSAKINCIPFSRSVPFHPPGEPSLAAWLSWSQRDSSCKEEPCCLHFHRSV